MSNDSPDFAEAGDITLHNSIDFWMNQANKIKNLENNIVTQNMVTEVMLAAGLEPKLGYESLAIDSDGQIIVCDRCNNFGYIDIQTLNKILRIKNG